MRECQKSKIHQKSSISECAQKSRAFLTFDHTQKKRLFLMKRGQITVFIILGIVVLISASFYFYFRTVRTGEFGERTVAPEEIVPVVEYIETCLYDTGSVAVEFLGQQAGYIYLPDNIRLNPFAYLQIVKNSPLKLPYWYYRGQSRVPSIESMQSDISRFVEENVDVCLRKFEPLSAQFEVEKLGKAKAITKITEDDVVIKLDYLFRIENLARKSTTKFSGYLTHLPVRLKHVYELSKDIMLRENSEMFFEDVTLNLMVLNPDIPFSDMYLDCSRPMWRVSEVEKSIKGTLASNLPRIRLENTKYEPFEQQIENYEKYDKYDNIELADIENIDIPEDLPADMYRYKQLFWRGFSKKYNNLETTFMYNTDWPIDLTVRPSDNGIMRSNTGRGPSKYAGFLCLATYHFTYDVIHPVEAVVSDPDSFQGDGYNFHFAFPVMINHNMGDRDTFTTTDFPVKDEIEGFCNEHGDRIVEIHARDNLLQDIDKVNITFECGRFRCMLGATKLDPPGIKLVTALPYSCSPGKIVAEKNGYWTAAEAISESEDRVYVKLKPMIQLKISLQKFTSYNYETPEPLRARQKVSLQIINDKIGYAQFRTIPSEDETMSDVLELPLMDENYEVFIMMFDKDFKGNDYLIGGYQGNLTTAVDSLAPASTITFNVIEHLPTPLEGSSEMMNMYLEIENEELKQKLKPVIR